MPTTHPHRFTPIGTLVKVGPAWPMSKRGPAELEPGTRYLVDGFSTAGDVLEVELADLEGRGLAVYVPAAWLELADDPPHPVTLPAPSSSPVGDRVPSVHLLLDIWQALGGDSEAFHPWWAADPSFPDRWAQIVAAVAGNISGLAADSNPPAGALLDIAIQFGAADRGEPT